MPSSAAGASPRRQRGRRRSRPVNIWRIAARTSRRFDPELGHATVAAAFVGRRTMSRGAFFDRRVFLISYDPLPDTRWPRA
jgi:uncharacterized protein YbcC (UPF0753/DUF2309 family)